MQTQTDSVHDIIDYAPPEVEGEDVAPPSCPFCPAGHFFYSALNMEVAWLENKQFPPTRSCPDILKAKDIMTTLQEPEPEEWEGEGEGEEEDEEQEGEEGEEEQWGQEEEEVEEEEEIDLSSMLEFYLRAAGLLGGSNGVDAWVDAFLYQEAFARANSRRLRTTQFETDGRVRGMHPYPRVK